MMVGIGETAFRMGLGPSIVQRKGDVAGYLEVAWTANLVLSILSLILLGAITPWLCEAVFHSPESINATWVMLLAIPLSSCINPACILLLKERRYRQLFLVGLPRNVIRYAAAPIVAVWLSSYWAMVWAYTAGFIAEVAISYIFLPNRARFYWNWPLFNELYKFSSWLQLNNLVKWLSRYLDSFVIGSTLSMNALGLYNRATTLASLPSQQVSMILFKVAFPLLASMQGEREKSGVFAVRMLDLAVLTYFPFVFAVLLAGEELVLLLLGPDWVSMVPTMQILVVSMVLRTGLDVVITALRSNGHSRMEFTNNLLRILVTGAALYPLARSYGMIGAAYAMLLGSVVAVPSVLITAGRALGLDWKRLLGSLLIVTVLYLPLIPIAHAVKSSVGFTDTWLPIVLIVGIGSGIAILAATHYIAGIGPFGTLMYVFQMLLRRGNRADGSGRLIT